MSAAYTLQKDTNQVLTETVTATNIAGAAITWALLPGHVSFDGDLDTLIVNSALITKTVGSGVSITDGPNGVFTVTFLPADTDDVPPGAGYWVLVRITTAAGAVLAIPKYEVAVAA